MNPIGLGTYNVKINPEVFSEFTKLGGTLVDSSPMYGDAELNVGRVTTELNIGDKLFMATKVWTTGKVEGLNQINQSFKLLKRTHIELFQIHNLVDWKNQLQTLRDFKAAGKIKHIGITHYSTAAFDDLAKVLKAERDIEFLQIPYSMAERTGEKKLIPLAYELGVKVIANEPFAQGRLFKENQGKPLPSGYKNWSEYFLKFILNNKAVQFVIPATSSLEHLRANMLALN